MRSAPFIPSGYKYLPKSSAIEPAGIDQVNRDSRHVLRRGYRLRELNWVLRLNRLERNLLHFCATFIVKIGLQRAGEEDAKTARKLDLPCTAFCDERSTHQACVGNGFQVGAHT